MFLFRMHSVGSVRPRPTAANAIIRWWNNAGVNDETTELAETAESEAISEATPTSGLNQEPNEIEEDVVVIQEEEMVLVRKEQQDPAANAVEEAVPAQPVPEGPPHPQCIEPEPTVSAPAPSNSKPKKKQQKRR
jgi:hypothetical protein